MKSDLKKEGYDKEEEYFNKLNQELIKKMRGKDLAAGGKKEETLKKDLSEGDAS